MKNNKSLLKILISVILMLNLCGCWGSRELGDLSIMVGLAFDKAEVPGNVLLTAQIVKPGEIKQTQGTEGATSKAYWNIKSSRPTVFNAIRDFTHITGKKLYISHNQVFIFGSDLASEGVYKYLDFFMRAHETRPTNLVLVSTGAAGKVLEVQSEAEKIPALNISDLIKSASFTADFK